MANFANFRLNQDSHQCYQAHPSFDTYIQMCAITFMDQQTRWQLLTAETGILGMPEKIRFFCFWKQELNILKSNFILIFWLFLWYLNKRCYSSWEKCSIYEKQLVSEVFKNVTCLRFLYEFKQKQNKIFVSGSFWVIKTWMIPCYLL